MSQSNFETTELLNAFIDGQLATDERMQIIDSLKHSDELSLELCELRRNDELLAMAFTDHAQPEQNLYANMLHKRKRRSMFLAAGVLFILSVGIGVNYFPNMMPVDEVAIQNLSELDALSNHNKRILIHISDMDNQKITAALNKTQALLQDKKQDLTVEIVANADGLGLLREGSPYRERIASLSSQHRNVSFKACGIAMNAARLKEGKDVKLIPEADRIPAALDEILNRLKQGWAYFKA